MPGNHDVYWVACKRAILDQEEKRFSDEELRDQMDSTKFDNFENFLTDFYGISRSEFAIKISHGAYIYENDDLNISIAALNSSEKESHQKEDHRGLLSKNQAQSLMEYWSNIESNSRIRIVAIHHNPTSNVPENINETIKILEEFGKDGKLDKEYVKIFASDIVGFEGRDHLQRISEEFKVQLILHGHHHAKSEKSWPWTGHKGVTHILSAGSWGLSQNELPKEQPNNIRLISINPEKSELRAWTLIFDPRAKTKGIISKGNFVSDPADQEFIQDIFIPCSYPKNFSEDEISPENEESKAKLIKAQELLSKNMEQMSCNDSFVSFNGVFQDIINLTSNGGYLSIEEGVQALEVVKVLDSKRNFIELFGLTALGFLPTDLQLSLREEHINKFKDKLGKIFYNNQKEILSGLGNYVPIVLMVMNKREAEELNKQEAVECESNQLRSEFNSFRTLLDEDWPNRYNANPRKWKPFKNNSYTIEE